MSAIIDDQPPLKIGAGCIAEMLVFTIAVLYMISAGWPFVFPNIQHVRTECPVIIAGTVTSAVDGGETVTERRLVVRCDYKAAGIPPPKYGYPEIEDAYGEEGSFRKDANKRRITKGDSFTCITKLRIYEALGGWEVTPNKILGLESCEFRRKR